MVAARVLAVALALADTQMCSPATGSSDGGTTGTATGTIGGQCTLMFTALCTHAINDCSETGFTLADCVASGQVQCCAASCSSKALSTDAVVNACINALEVESCNDVAVNAVPAQCMGVPALQ
jgi:hypothetical protein